MNANDMLAATNRVVRPVFRGSIHAAASAVADPRDVAWDALRDRLEKLYRLDAGDATRAAIDQARLRMLHVEQDPMRLPPPAEMLPTPDGGLTISILVDGFELQYNFEPDGSSELDCFRGAELLWTKDLDRLPGPRVTPAD